MKKENLVILRDNISLITKDGTRIIANEHYRCIEVSEGKEKQFMVYGIVFDDKTFNKLFEYSHDVILRDFKTLGILGENNEPISKSLFNNQASVHQYGKGKDKLSIVFFYIHPKELLYGFYPVFKGETKASIVNSAYRSYIEIIEGNMGTIDDNDVQRGNSGIPLSYRDISFRNIDVKELSI